MKLDFTRYVIIMVFILAGVIGIIFKSNTDFYYVLITIFTFIFIITWNLRRIKQKVGVGDDLI